MHIVKGVDEMGLGTLEIIYTLLFLISGISQVFLYISIYRNKKSIFIINMLIGLVLSWIVYSSLPSNYMIWRSIAVLIGLSGIIGFFLKLKNNKYNLLSKLMISISVLGGLIGLIL